MPLCAPEDTDDSASVASSSYDDVDSILPVCAVLAERMFDFLETEAETEILRAVQAQTRIALGVIEEALEKYRLVCCVLPISAWGGMG